MAWNLLRNLRTGEIVVSNYILKRPVMDVNRLQKSAKLLLKNCADDRKVALEVHEYFKRIVEDNPQDVASKGLMVDCLKLAQTSGNNAIKIINILSKLADGGEVTGETAAGFPSFNDLAALSDGQKA